MVNVRLVQTLFLCLPLATYAAGINDYFNIKAGGEDVGGCDGTYGSKTGHQWLKQWFDELGQSNDAAIKAIDEYGTTPSARGNLLVFMGIKPAESQTEPEEPEKYQAVRENYRAMKTFLNKPRPQKPWIFCSAGWMQEREWTDPLEVETGERGSPAAKKPKKPEIKIEDVYKDRKGHNINPYWMPDIKNYIFETQSNTIKFCDNSGASYGATLDAEVLGMGDDYPGTITICMTKITRDKGWTDTLGAKTPIVGERIEGFLSKSGTLYHELFHLVLGTAHTPDNFSGALALIRRATSWSQDSDWTPAQKDGYPPWLPEGLAMFAEAHWLSQNRRSGLEEAQWWSWSDQGKTEKHPKTGRRGRGGRGG